MNRTVGSIVALVLIGSSLLLAPIDKSLFAADATASRKPNFVFILVDDLGWTDGSGLGSKFYQTPHIDRLAQQGMRFTDAYAACCVCSPTRAAVMTGRYPARLHLTDWIAGHKRPLAKLAIPDWKMYLDHDEITIAEVLKAAGYATAHIGKWHLGGAEYRPETQGFDLNIGGDHRGQPPSYFAPYRIPSIAEGPSGEYLTDRLTDEAERFIQRNRQQPFFLYLAHYAVHTPLQAKKELIEKYQAAAQPDQPHRNAVYAAMIESVDQSVGRIVNKLQQLGIEKQTVIFVTHDIEEAVYLGDRIAVMTPNPGKIKSILEVPLPRPRKRTDPVFVELRDQLYENFLEKEETHEKKLPDASDIVSMRAAAALSK
mgnify:CR=1 FL=1